MRKITYECIKRELYEETEIRSEKFQELGHFVFGDDKCIFHTYLCITDCDKNSITLQKGETMSYKWINEEEFIKFVNSNEMISNPKKPYMEFFKEKGYLNL